MKILVVGASGATGRLLVKQLVYQGHDVKVIVRSIENLPEFMKDNNRVALICASVLELTDDEMIKYVGGCDAVASCLGHNMTWKGIYGNPRRLVTDTASRLCDAITLANPEHPVKYILMNTDGNSNRDLNEPISFAQKCIIGLLRLLLPPHVDNEKAADYLRSRIGQNNPHIEWAAVRPTNLIDNEEVSEYEVYSSPIKSAIFDSGKVSRINVANFMAELITKEEVWSPWKGKMPVIYDKVS